MARAWLIEADEDPQPECAESSEPTMDFYHPPGPVGARRVQIRESPYFYTYFNNHVAKVTLDSGSETNLVSESFAAFIGAPVTKSTQIARQADGQSPLCVTGETRFILCRDN